MKERMPVKERVFHSLCFLSCPWFEGLTFSTIYIQLLGFSIRISIL
jgi:hypothetical protein